MLKNAAGRVAALDGRCVGGSAVAMRSRVMRSPALRSSGLPAPFAGLETVPALLLAVSGGPDSIALMLLAVRWAAALGAGAPALHVATVDHGLRAESAGEACGVAAAAQALGLPHATLPWLGPKPEARIQERARQARYALLAAHAASVGAGHLLTGHHAEDQAETVLFRLGRGSGIGGLAGMRRETPLGPRLVLVRPLLAHAKADLVAICRAAGAVVVDDPSNRDPAFARARLRAMAPATAALGLDTPTLLRLACRAARMEEALASETLRCLAMVDTPTQGRFEAHLAPLGVIPLEILIRIIRIAVERTVPGDRPPRLDRLETLATQLSAALNAGRAHRATLGGACVILQRDTMLFVAPETPRRRGRSPGPIL